MLDFLQARFNLTATGEPKLLSAGIWNQVYRIPAGERSYVLRLAHPTATEKAMAFTHRVMWDVSLPEVSPPIPDVDGNTVVSVDGRLAALFPFVEGERLNRAKVEARQAGALLGRLHQATLSLDLPTGETWADLDWEANSMWIWEDVERALTDRDHEKKHGLEQSSAFLRERLRECRDWVEGQSGNGHLRACTHGDYHPGNLIGRDRRIVAAIDWDEARVDWLFWEVGRALGEWDGAPEFLEGYWESGAPSFDPGLLRPVMAFAKLVDVLWDLSEEGRILKTGGG